MTKVLVLGASGQIAQLADQMLINDNNDVTLFLRDTAKLKLDAKLLAKATVVTGDVLDANLLKKVMTGVDIVYANLAGKVIDMARLIVDTMHETGVKRIVWISTLGIYDEVPGKFGEWNNTTLGDYITNYAAAAKIIEDSDLDYTIIRPAWLTDKDEVDYEVTQRNDPFKGTEVSRKSVATVVTEIVAHPDKYKRASIGLNKPNTDGDKPAWY